MDNFSDARPAVYRICEKMYWSDACVGFFYIHFSVFWGLQMARMLLKERGFYSFMMIRYGMFSRTAGVT